MGLAHSSFTSVPTGRYWIGTPVHKAVRGMKMHHPGKLITIVSLEDIPFLLQESNKQLGVYTIIYNSRTEKTVAIVRV